jgi:hypothetical protein
MPGALADLITHYPDAIDDLIKQGKVVGSRVDLACAGVGVTVNAGCLREGPILHKLPKKPPDTYRPSTPPWHSRAGGGAVHSIKSGHSLGLSRTLPRRPQTP